LICAQDMLRIAPDQAELWRQAGELNQSLERAAAARDCYLRYLEIVPQGAVAERLRVRLDVLRSKLH
jgi:regulator of sirC expression with transglutaminase-like and TPR domain